MIDRLLPAYCYSKRRLKICGIILHYFSAINVEPSMPFDMEVCRNLFVDLNRPRPEREHYLKKPSDPKVRMYASAHILLGRDGEEYRLVPFDKQAYHAGDSVLNGRRYCNRFTLGIELAGTRESGFTEPQYQRLATITAALMAAHRFSLDWVNGHDQVRHNAINERMTTARKYDPSGAHDGSGSNFDWDLYRSLVI